MRRLSSVLCALSAAATSASAQETLLLRQPSVSARHIAFAYANNIWIADRAGGAARRLTSFQGQTADPKLSPDGSVVAFTGTYAGNADEYVVPVSGGEPKRLTWHPGGDAVTGWTPDGKQVVFASGRATWAPTPAPRIGFFNRDGQWDVENVGVPADIDIENWPKDVIAGRDPQLERAVQEALKLLDANPVRRQKEPAGPTWGKRQP